MCGIVGFVGIREAAPVLVSALQKLEYRGYDSAGLATVVAGQLWLKKDVGKLADVQEKHQIDKLPGQCGIGHVRWATHGKVTAANAHPHIDCQGQIAIVHNGIIDNHRELWRRLRPGHRLVSDTDTEVIAHIIEEHAASSGSLEEAVLRATQELKGSYALAVISAKEPAKLIASRKGSPLVVGVGNSGNFVASDALCFLEQARRVIFVEDGESVVLTPDRVFIIDRNGKRYTREPTEINWTWSEASKADYDFFMLKEIMEQPQTLRRALKQDKDHMMKVASEVLHASRVIFTACGTSRYASMVGRYLLTKISHKSSEVVTASEFDYFSDAVDRDTLVLAVSQSGETADVIDSVKMAKEKGAKIISIVNVVGSSLARISDWVIYLNCGPEIAVAATKSFLAQLAVFYLLGFAMVNRFEEGVDKLALVSELIGDNLVLNQAEIPWIAKTLANKDKFYYIGRGINLAIAEEGALKLKEVAYVHAEGMPAGELKHGTLALIDNETPVVAICPNDCTFDAMLSNVAETKVRGASVIGISDRQDIMFDAWIEIPRVEEIFYPLVSIVPLQLFAYHSAIVRGLNPDKPRNLAKSVTVK